MCAIELSKVPYIDARGTMSISCILSGNDHEEELKRRAQDTKRRIRLDWDSLFESPNAEALTVVLDTYTARANTRKFMEPEARQKLLDLGYFDLARRVEKQVQKRQQ